MGRDSKKNGKDHVCSTRRTGSSGSDYEKTKILFEAVRKVRSIQTYNPPIVFNGAYRLDIVVHGGTRADEDNIRKAFNDALQRCAFGNDRNSKGGSIEIL